MRAKRWMPAGLSAVVILAAASLARAQVLADRVPDDALAYAGWAGTDALGPAYDGSHLKTFLEALNLPALIAARMDPAAQSDPQTADRAKFAQALLMALAKAPTALYAGPLDVATNPVRPMPRLALLSKVGNGVAQSLAARLNAALQANRRPNQPASGAVATGDFLLIWVGDAGLPDRFGAAAPGHALADAEAFKKAMAQANPGTGPAAVAVYVDAQALAESLANIVAAQNNPQTRQVFPALADGLGLDSLRQVAWAGSFAGANWQSRSFVGMRDRRPGLLALLDNAPLS